MLTLSNTTALETIYACILRQNLKQFALCSPQKQSGNSQLALAIAIRAARSGKRVLLIEFNPQSAGLSRQLEISRNEWLPLTGHWEHAVQETRYPGLLVLTSPLISSHCIEFRDQETLNLFFNSCNQRFDLVICDCAPINHSCEPYRNSESGQSDRLKEPHKSEASPSYQKTTQDSLPIDIICAASQATLLNVVTGQTTESQVDEANEILKQSGALLSGVIMNDRFTPGLKEELIRETHRLDRLLPKWMAKLRDKFNRMVLLNQEL